MTNDQKKLLEALMGKKEKQSWQEQIGEFLGRILGVLVAASILGVAAAIGYATFKFFTGLIG